MRLRCVALFLSILAVTCVAYQIGDVPIDDAFFSTNLPKLETPTDLWVYEANLSKGEAVIRWDFDVPRNLSLREVEFVLKLITPSKPVRKFFPRFKNPPFGYIVHDLSPETRYLVELRATAPNWLKSDAARTSFSTLYTVWPTPKIKEVSKRVHENFVEYSLHWVVRRRLGLLWLFEVEVCDGQCHSYVRNKTESFARVPARFNTEVTITVTALYDATPAGMIRRVSKPYIGHSVKGGFEKILELKVKKVNNTIKLPWHPLLPPFGPRSFYEVFACQPVPGEGRSRLPTSSSTYKYAAHLVDDVSKEMLGRERFYLPKMMSVEKSAILLMGKHVPVKPLVRVLYANTTTCVRFRIKFLQPNVNRFFETEEARSSTELVLGPSLAEIFEILPNENYTLSIHSCLTDGTTRPPKNVCGNFTRITLQSNVAAPSEVVDPIGRYNFPSMWRLYWQLPEEPRGPISGFLIEVADKDDTKFKNTELNVVSREIRTFFLPFGELARRPNVRIAAFNIDHRNNTLCGPWKTVEFTKDLYGDIFVFLVISVVMALIGCMIYICCNFFANTQRVQDNQPEPANFGHELNEVQPRPEARQRVQLHGGQDRYDPSED